MSSSQCLRLAASRSLRRISSRCPTSFSAAHRTGNPTINLPRSLSTLPLSRSSILSSSNTQKPLRALRPSSLSLEQSRHYADRTVQVPQMAESITEGTLKQFSKQVGDHVEQDEEIATIETDKIDVAVNAPEAGTIKELLVKEEDTVTVGQDLVVLETGGSGSGGDQAKSEPKEPASDKQETSSQPEGGQEKEAPKEEKPSKDKQPPKDDKPAKDEKSDQDKPSKQTESTPQPPKPASESKSPSPQQEKKPSQAKSDGKSGQQDQGPFGGSRQENRVKMNRMRLRIAERLKQSQNTAASLTTFNEVDMSSLMDFRKLYKDEILKKTGVKLGFMSAFSRACVLAMKELPAVNASIEGPGSGDTIVYRDYVDISVAVATEKGLVTPVVRNAESMDMIQIEQEIANLGKKARDNKLTIEDMAGGTFTISNGGVFGSLYGTPIINLPQTAVLGLHAIKDKPVAINGKVEIRPMMYLALTYDHRLLDGREAVTFLVKVKEFIEDPRKMLLGI